MPEMLIEAARSQEWFDNFSPSCPAAVVQSSRGRGWQNICVMRFRHQPGALAVPPLAAHAVIIQLSSAPLTADRIGKQHYDRCVRQGETAILPAGLSSEWNVSAGSASESLHIYLRPEFVRAAAIENWDACPEDLEIRPQVGAIDARTRFISYALHQELNDTEVAGGVCAESLARLLAVHLLREYSTARPPAREHKGGLAPHKLRRAIEYIHANLSEELPLSAMAAEVGISPDNFCRSFKQSVGVAPHQYVIRERVETAKRLLRETELTVAEVAYRVGCNSQSRLTLLFRRHMGVTPTAYRKDT